MSGLTVKEAQLLDCAKFYDACMLKEAEKVVRKVIVKRVQKRGATEVFSQLLRHPNVGELADAFVEYDENEEAKDWGKLSSQKTHALFVTLSPEPDVFQFEEMYDSVQKLLNKKRVGVLYSVWTYEQSGTVKDLNVGYHPHVHALIVLNKSDPSGERKRVRTTIVNALSKFQTKGPHFLQVKAVSENGIKSKIEYLKGEKTDPRKLPLVEADKIWRNNNDLCHLYFNDPESSD